MEDNFQINSAAISDRGLSEKRPQNEDSFLEMRNIGVFAVADGVGGAQAGDVASQMAMEIIGEAFSNLQSGGDAEVLMKLAIEKANSAIFQMSTDLPQLSTMATTIVALQLSGNIATIGHVGDSRLYRLDPKASLLRETQDHSVVEEEVRAGRMTPAQAANHPSRNVISRALGAEQTVEVDMKTIMIEPNTSFLLCSDGITRHISDFEIRQLMLTAESPEIICQKMKEMCYRRGAEDNLTAVIIQVAQAGAQTFAPLQASKVDEAEEATVATARASGDGAGGEKSNFYEDESPTQDLSLPTTAQFVPLAEKFSQPETPPAPATISMADDEESYLMQESPNVPTEIPDTISFTSNETEEIVPETREQISPVVPAEKSAEPVRYQDYPSEKSGGGILGKMLMGILLLAVGAIIGVAAFYFFTQYGGVAPTEPQKPLEAQSSNIPFTEFEKGRRAVDSNPVGYIEQVKSRGDNAEDLYLLGRAYLLTGKPTEAGEAFNKAKALLPETKTDNRQILGNEIAMGVALVGNSAALREFQTMVNAANTESKKSRGNTNTPGNANGASGINPAGQEKEVQ